MEKIPCSFVYWIGLTSLFAVLIRAHVATFFWRLRVRFENRAQKKRWAKGHLSPQEMKALMKWIESDDDV